MLGKREASSERRVAKRRRWDVAAEGGAGSSAEDVWRPLDGLPDEVLLRILQYLPLRERIGAEKVSRRFQNLSKASWTDVKFLKMKEFAVRDQTQREQPFAPLRKQVCRSVWSRARRWVQEVDFTGLPFHPHPRAAATSLLHPSVWCELVETNFRNLKALSFGPKTLRSSRLVGRVLPEVMGSFSGQNVEKLVFRKAFGNVPFDHGIGQLLKQCPNLRHLDVTWSRKTDGSFLHSLHGERLEYLCLKQIGRDIRLGEMFRGKKFPALRHLELQSISTTRDFSIAEVCTSAPHLKVLLARNLLRWGKSVETYEGIGSLALERLAVSIGHYMDPPLSEFLVKFVRTLVAPESRLRDSLKDLCIRGEERRNQAALERLGGLWGLERLEFLPVPPVYSAVFCRNMGCLPNFRGITHPGAQRRDMNGIASSDLDSESSDSD